ncbi:MAG: DUF5685 family protein [Gammaproteobacteria bacterium]
MLGHIKPPLCRLDASAKMHYRQAYCSVCYSLRRQFGLPAALLLNHELALSVAALPHHCGATVPPASCACPAQLFLTRRTVAQHSIIDRAARYRLVLAWLKLADWEAELQCLRMLQRNLALRAQLFSRRSIGLLHLGKGFGGQYGSSRLL